MKTRFGNPVWASIVVLMLVSLNGVCQGEVRHYQLPEGKRTSGKTLSVYLPEDYSKSDAHYPVVYLLHGCGGNNLTFLGGGYVGLMSNANVSVIADELRQKKHINLPIIVCPDLNTIGSYTAYLLRNVIPFVDATFRTIPSRESRAIAGHSIGGYRALSLALEHPEVFGIAGGLSSYITTVTQFDGLVKERNQESGPILFWLYAGRQDQYGITQPNRDLVELLKTNNLSATYVEDDGNHESEVAMRLGELLEYLSQWLKR
jgi:enterochelin esterase-like enzyme